MNTLVVWILGCLFVSVVNGRYHPAALDGSSEDGPEEKLHDMVSRLKRSVLDAADGESQESVEAANNEEEHWPVEDGLPFPRIRRSLKGEDESQNGVMFQRSLSESENPMPAAQLPIEKSLYSQPGHFILPLADPQMTIEIGKTTLQTSGPVRQDSAKQSSSETISPSLRKTRPWTDEQIRLMREENFKRGSNPVVAFVEPRAPFHIHRICFPSKHCGTTTVKPVSETKISGPMETRSPLDEQTTFPDRSASTIYTVQMPTVSERGARDWEENKVIQDSKTSHGKTKRHQHDNLDIPTSQSENDVGKTVEIEPQQKHGKVYKRVLENMGNMIEKDLVRQMNA